MGFWRTQVSHSHVGVNMSSQPSENFQLLLLSAPTCTFPPPLPPPAPLTFYSGVHPSGQGSGLGHQLCSCPHCTPSWK